MTQRSDCDSDSDDLCIAVALANAAGIHQNTDSSSSDSDDVCIAVALAGAAGVIDGHDTDGSESVNAETQTPAHHASPPDPSAAPADRGSDTAEGVGAAGDVPDAAAKPAPKKRAKPAAGTSAAAKPKKSRAEGAAPPAAAAKAKKPAKLTQDEATEMVATWFRKENKPTMPAALIAALGSRVSKTQTQVALDALVANGQVVTRDIKKAVIYFANQAAFSALSPEETLRLKDSIAASKARLLEMDAHHRDVTARAAAITVVSNDEIRAKVEHLKGVVAALKARVGADDPAGAVATVDRHVMEGATHSFVRLQRQWRAIRRVGTGIVDSFALDRRAEEVAAELGISEEDPALVAAATNARVPQAFSGAA
jgi:hypothetical protein